MAGLLDGVQGENDQGGLLDPEGWKRLTSSLYRILRLGGPGSMGGGTFFIGEIKNFAFFQTRKFSKNVKKSIKNLYFLKIYM